MGLSGKDIFLHLANEYGDSPNVNLEFGGSGLAGIPMHDRRTIATQCAEVSADFGTFEPDDVLATFLDRRLFFRNAVNAGLPAMTVPGATRQFHEGDTGTFDLTAGTWRNDTTGASGRVPKLPDLILDIIDSGGVLPRLVEQGYLPSELGDLLRSPTVAIRGAGSGA